MDGDDARLQAKTHRACSHDNTDSVIFICIVISMATNISSSQRCNYYYYYYYYYIRLTASFPAQPG